MRFETFMESILPSQNSIDDNGAEGTLVFIHVKDGAVVDVRMTDANGVAYVYDDDEGHVGQFEWPETQL